MTVAAVRRLNRIEKLARDIDAMDPRLVDEVGHAICRFANGTLCPCADRKGGAKGCCDAVRTMAQAIVLQVKRHG